jgi:hypothetical protein
VALLLKGEPQAALEAMQKQDSVWGLIGLPMAYHALGRQYWNHSSLSPGDVNIIWGADKSQVKNPSKWVDGCSLTTNLLQFSVLFAFSS